MVHVSDDLAAVGAREGGVLVPAGLCGAVWSALVKESRRRQVLDGGAGLSPEMEQLLAELLAADAPPAPQPEASSACGSGVAGSGTVVVMSSREVAERHGCTPRWARHLAAGPLGGRKVGRDWLVDADVFESWLEQRRATG